MVSQVITEDLIEGFGSRLRLGGFLMALLAFVFFFCRLDGINGWSDESNSKTYIKA